MNRIFKNRLLPTLILFGLISCSTRHITPEEITAFVDDFEKKAEYLSRRLAETRWDYYLRSESDSLEFFLSAYRAMYADPGQLATIKSYLSLVKDETYRRKLELIYRGCQRGAVDYDRNLLSLVGSLASHWGRESKTVSFEGNPVSREQLRRRLASETDRGKRREIYMALNRGDDRIAEELGPLARKRNQAASRLGYNSYYDLMLKAEGLDKAELIDLIDDLDRLSADSYRRTLDSLKDVLKIDQIGEGDLWYILYRNDEQCEIYYSADRQNSLLEATVNGLGFKLRSLPIYFGAVSSDVRGPGSAVLPVQAPNDIRIPVEIRDGEQSLARLFEQVGKALYAVNIEPQDFLLAHPPASCFEQGAARMISVLIESGNWKVKYGGLPEPLASASLAAGRVRALYELRRALVEIGFERRLYTDPYADLHQVYAQLFEKYMMIPLETGIRPWADIAFVTEAVGRQNRLVGECVAAQTYHYLRGKYGAVLDDQNTKAFLVQNYYRFGARDDWQKLLERGTGERLKAEYYPGFPFD